nr:synaptobrevin, longin-like domain protein [Tanacetum cinerariifolium]
MIAILEKYEHDFHQIVDFVEASHIRYALTLNPTVYVSHIRQFWSTARIETTEEGTKILAIVDGKLRTVSESSIRRNLKLNDEAGISSLPDSKLFENLQLMGYNILPNQKFTFQKGQFSHQWKYLIHTIMQCMSSKSTGFNEFSSNIATALVCLATNRVYNFSKMIFNGSGPPTESHHTPTSEASQSSQHDLPSPSLPPATTATIPPVIPTLPLPTVVPTDTPHLRHYTRRARIAQSSALLPVADEPASPIGDSSQGEACPIDFGLAADEDRANIAKTSTLTSDSTPRVTSLAADEGTQELEINSLKARIKLLEDKDKGVVDQSGDDAPIKGRSLDKGDEAAKRVSDDTKEMETVLTSMDAASILTSGGVQVIPTAAEVATATVSIPTRSGVVSTASLSIPTATPIFTTAIESTPYSRRKGKETMVESETPKKKKVQEQIDAQLARELEEKLTREDQRMFDQIARDAEVARIHAEEELQMMIDGLDKNNELIAKHLQEYYQAAEDLTIGEKIELINERVKYQDHHSKILHYQAQQRKPRTKKQKRDYYMAVIKGHSGWKTKDFKGMSFEETKAKFTTVWKQIEDFIPIGSKEEGERFKRKWIRFEHESVKRLKTSEETHEEVKSPEVVPEEKVKEMMQLVPVEEIYVDSLQVKHPIIDWKVHTEGQRSYWKITRLVKESLSIRPAASDKEIKLWVELKRLYEPDDDDQLWTHTQNLMHAPVEWKMYDTCGVHHVTSKDKEIFMLVEKDYPLRKGLAIGRIVGNKMHKAFSLPIMKFPLSEEVPTASEESSHCQKKRDATAEKLALLLKSSRNCQSKTHLCYSKTASLSQLSPDAVTKILTLSLDCLDAAQGITTPFPATVRLFFFNFGVEL